MLGPYENEDEMLGAILYWQRRAFQAEKEIVNMRERKYQDSKVIAFYKQQFLDKDKEMHEVIDKFRIELGRRIVALKYLKGEL